MCFDVFVVLSHVSLSASSQMCFIVESLRHLHRVACGEMTIIVPKMPRWEEPLRFTEGHRFSSCETAVEPVDMHKNSQLSQVHKFIFETLSAAVLRVQDTQKRERSQRCLVSVSQLPLDNKYQNLD